MTQVPAVVRFAASLFVLGLEGYDAAQKLGPTKGATNIGGAKVFYHPKWRTADSKISFLNPVFEKAIKELPVTLYTLNKIDVDKDGNPVFVKDRQTGQNTDQYSRSHTGLMLYSQFYEDPKGGERIRGRLLEALNSTFDATNYIEVASKIPGEEIKVLDTLTYQDPVTRTPVQFYRHAAVIINLPSGPTSGFWQMKTMKTATRAGMSAATTADPAETGNLPF
jgi:DNA-binding beta-propeller fold protein YncE